MLPELELLELLEPERELPELEPDRELPLEPPLNELPPPGRALATAACSVRRMA
jgi:hypothetical protein